MQGRGLLFPQMFEIQGGGVIAKPLSAAKFHSAILYWDKFVCPTNDFVHVGLPEEETLIREGVLSRPKPSKTPGGHQVMPGIYPMDEIFSVATENQIEAFAKLDRKDPGYWCLTEIPPEQLASTSEFSGGRSALITLTEALPLPPAKTPVEDLLAFKQKRNAELRHLRSALDKIYLTIVENPDRLMTTQVALNDLDQSIANLMKSSREWWKAIRLTDVKTIVGLSAAAIAASLGFSIAMPTVAAAAGGVRALLTIRDSIKSKLKQERASPYWYAVSVQKELGGA